MQHFPFPRQHALHASRALCELLRPLPCLPPPPGQRPFPKGALLPCTVPGVGPAGSQKVSCPAAAAGRAGPDGTLPGTVPAAERRLWPVSALLLPPAPPRQGHGAGPPPVLQRS